ncbi:MAG: response regulator, partial [Oscillospiraceae bacterium]|nr:response regulator [Oscillospiraceae bacterium]
IGDELRIKQILNNLLSNAFKYTEIGEVTLSISSEPAKSQQSGAVDLVFNVRDSGVGMTKEQITTLFDEYSRFNQESGRTIEGTGLGLAITKHLTSLMNGDIQVDSEPGVGSSFTLRLQQCKVDSEVIGNELAEQLQQFQSLNNIFPDKDPHSITHEQMPYGSVLIVDDVEMNLYVAQMLMKPYGLHIETVLSGFEAISKIKSGKVYDIIFMDHMMPKMNGIEATKQLRALGYIEPIVALTANALAGQADVFLQNGFDAFISKPIDTRQLASVLNKLIRDKQPMDVIEAARRESNSQQSKKIVPKRIADGVMIDKDIDGLDIVKGLKRYDSDDKVYLSVLRIYAAGIRSMLDTIEVVNEDNIKDYEISVHGIKGSSLDIFANHVAESARRLEEAAKNGDLSYMTEHNPIFLKTVRKLVGNIENMISSINAKTQKQKKEKPDRNTLNKLSAACEIYNLSGANAAMEELEAYSYESDNDLITWLRDRVDIMSYPEIIQKISTIL